MIVYRVEDADARGPYSESKWELWDRYGGNEGPGGYRAMPQWPLGFDLYDWKHRVGAAPRFAFPSETAFKYWFDSSLERAKLADHGYALSVYEVPDDAVVTATNSNQVVFNHEQATRLERKPLL